MHRVDRDEDGKEDDDEQRIWSPEGADSSKKLEGCFVRFSCQNCRKAKTTETKA
ncbi:unnamed protein product [Dovyalis caffra]|uniref:Uncharacterized protein n=1 Tax=Dovyalis caffra TaxID=77055 RepID=A0AAV1RJ91_9ROSI|nr:unnamed protein product [Dovyalis caffra]